MTSFALFAVAISAGGLRASHAIDLAKINNEVITLEEFNRKYQENLKFFQGKAPTKKAVLDDLIKRELGIQEARKMALDKDPDIVERMNTVLYHALLDKRLSKEFETIHITDEEAKEYYSKNPEIRTSHIFIGVPPGATAEDDKKALERIKKIQDEQIKPGKSSFADIAQRFSEGVAAPMGGDIDFQTKDKLDPHYYQEALKLKSVGKVSGIVRTQFGYHIIKLTGLRSWEEVDKGLIKRLLFEERRAKIFDTFMTKLRQQNKVTVNEKLLTE